MFLSPSASPNEALRVFASITFGVPLQEKKGGVTEMNSTDVIGKTAVNYGEAVLERLYACGT